MPAACGLACEVCGNLEKCGGCMAGTEPVRGWIMARAGASGASKGGSELIHFDPLLPGQVCPNWPLLRQSRGVGQKLTHAREPAWWLQIGPASNSVVPFGAIDC